MIYRCKASPHSSCCTNDRFCSRRSAKAAAQFLLWTCRRSARHDLEVEQICRLCLKSAELRKSHVLPEFLYQPLYDQKHRFTSITLDGSEFPRTRLEQKGYREKLLCQACETQISKYEDYAARNYFSEPTRVCLTLPELRGRSYGFQYSNLNYDQLKLFQLSILWRVSIASIPAFSHISLGAAHDERIRDFLARGIAPDPNAYPCFITEDQNIPRGSLWGSPLTHGIEEDGAQIVTIFVDNQFWQFQIAECVHPTGQMESIAKTWLAVDGIIMGIWRNLRESPFYDQLQQEASGWSDDFRKKLGL